MLDLFCGAGGAAMGYHRAGFDVVGVDNRPQPRYPFEFHQGDAMTWPLDGYDAVHASPPCQDHSTLAAFQPSKGTGWMLAAIRDRLTASGLPYVIENVMGAPMPGALKLCGTELGLRTETRTCGEVWLRRHRQFESNVFLLGAGRCHCHLRRTVGVYGGAVAGRKARAGRRVMVGPGSSLASREVMGIDWMTRDELDQAIPPAYTEFVGEQLLERVVFP
jgi:DNA (cytosine-5)-methyltransferase 1